MDTLLQDLRYGIRTLAKSPGFTAVAVLSLALGIGVNTSIFSFVDFLLLRPLPLPQSNRLVSVFYHDQRTSQIYSAMSYPDYEYYRDHNEVLSGLAAYDDVEVSLQTGDGAEKLPGEIVSGNYFSVLDVRPLLGRSFLPEEDRMPGANPVVMLSYGLWQRRFGSDPGIVGQRITLNGNSFAVVGIAPPAFRGLRVDRASVPEFWVPLMMYREIMPLFAEWDLEHRWGTQWLAATGRLKPGATLAQAGAVMATLSQQLRQAQWDREFKDMAHDWTAVLLPANQSRIPPGYRSAVVTFLGMLATVVGLVLLIACFNVANLMLARASQRRKEVAVRLALGAGRGRLVRQLLTESLLISLLGGTAGLIVAFWTSEFLSSFHRPFKTQLLLETRLDTRVLGFALLISVLTGIVFGLAPALQAARLDLTFALKAETSAAGIGFRKIGLRNGLVITQIAFSLLLLIGAGLFVRTLRNAQAADVTLDPGNVLLLKLDLSGQKYDDARGKQFYPQLLERVQSLPGVRSAALVYVVPLVGGRGGTDIVISPPENPSDKQTIQVDFNVVSPGYFETIGIPILRGRDFTDRDRGGAPAVAIVNEQFARRFWPGQDAIGKQFQGTNLPGVIEVVGVARDGKFRNYRASINPCFYVSLLQDYQKAMSLEVRAAADAMSIVAAVRREVRALDKNLPVSDYLTLKSHRDAGLSQEKSAAALLTALGLLALVLAAVGIYGVMSFSVAQRTREVGLRMALGARAGEVLRLMLRQGLLLILIGIGIGLAAALVLTRFVASLLYGVSATDPVTFAAFILALTAVALAACYIPARRAMKVDPMAALRHE